MNIVIPTYERPRNQITANTLKAAGVPYTLILNDTDTYDYGEHHTVKVTCHGITDKRNAILDLYGHDKIVMLDDDLRFYRRIRDKYPPASKEDVFALFCVIEVALDQFAHVGVTQRFMAHAKPKDFLLDNKYNHVLAYNFKLLPTGVNRPRFRFTVHEDHDFNLQLLSAGAQNIVLTEFAQEDAGEGAAGGCSMWRTPELDYAELEKFAAAWPKFVRIVDRRPRISWRHIAEV